MHQSANSDRGEPGQEGKGNQPTKLITIVVNGRKKETAVRALNFEEVVRLAFEDAVFNDVTIYTITFKRGHGDRPEGTLVEGEAVKLKEGMIFNVARTDKS
jgi:hypothetical protein